MRKWITNTREKRVFLPSVPYETRKIDFIRIYRSHDVVYRVILGLVDAEAEEEYRSVTVSRSVGRSVGRLVGRVARFVLALGEDGIRGGCSIRDDGA